MAPSILRNGLLAVLADGHAIPEIREKIGGQLPADRFIIHDQDLDLSADAPTVTV